METNELPDANEILAMLRSDDQEKRQRGLRLLYPGEFVTLVIARPTNMSMTSTVVSVNQGLFVALMWATQTMGRALGFQLNWVQDQNQLVVPKGLQLMK